jgi:hypothetical protein
MKLNKTLHYSKIFLHSNVGTLLKIRTNTRSNQLLSHDSLPLSLSESFVFLPSSKATDTHQLSGPEVRLVG